MEIFDPRSKIQNPKSKIQSPKSKGFTLIELLVVVAIIAVLIAILLPSLAMARASAKRATCAAQLHQWSLLLTNYAGENNGWLPKPYDGSGDPYGTAMWPGCVSRKFRDLFYPKYGSRDFFFCPAALDWGLWNQTDCFISGRADVGSPDLIIIGYNYVPYRIGVYPLSESKKTPQKIDEPEDSVVMADQVTWAPYDWAIPWECFGHRKGSAWTYADPSGILGANSLRSSGSVEWHTPANWQAGYAYFNCYFMW
ncbi:MAG: type II secretion system protein [Phycisphaerae bacterium]